MPNTRRISLWSTFVLRIVNRLLIFLKGQPPERLAIVIGRKGSYGKAQLDWRNSCFASDSGA